MSDQSDAPFLTGTLFLASDDLMSQSRIREAARPMGYAVETFGTDAKLSDALLTAIQNQTAPAAILVNLSARRFDPFALIQSLKGESQTHTIPILAFAGHVETEKHTRAREAGADRVVANSSVALHLSQLLPRLLDNIKDYPEKEETDVL